MDGGAWRATVHGVAKSQTGLSDFTFTFHFHALEKEMATHSSVLAWRIPGTGEPGGLPSMGSHRVGHDWSDLAAAVALLLNFYDALMFLKAIGDDQRYSWNTAFPCISVSSCWWKHTSAPFPHFKHQKLRISWAEPIIAKRKIFFSPGFIPEFRGVKVASSEGSGEGVSTNW